jgi:hypothetical protein
MMMVVVLQSKANASRAHSVSLRRHKSVSEKSVPLWKQNAFDMSTRERTLRARDALALGSSTTIIIIGHVERVAVFTHV